MFHSDILCFPDWFLDIRMSKNYHERTYLKNVPTKVVTVRKYQLPPSHVEKRRSENNLYLCRVVNMEVILMPNFVFMCTVPDSLTPNT
jgi:hypothetical protein